jgi:hypothetical protein
MKNGKMRKNLREYYLEWLHDYAIDASKWQKLSDRKISDYPADVVERKVRRAADYAIKLMALEALND